MAVTMRNMIRHSMVSNGVHPWGIATFLELSFREPCVALIIGIRELDSLEYEKVHQTRVAIRTLQAYLETFDEFLNPRNAREFHAWLKDTHKSLTHIRNLDVFSELIRSAEVAVADKQLVNEFITEQRVEETAKLLPKLTPEVIMESVHRIEIFSSRLPLRNKILNKKIETQHKLLLSAVGNTWGSFTALRKKFMKNQTPKRMHRLRISAKNVRYVYELCNRMGLIEHPKRLREVIALQDQLGTNNDIYNFRQWLRLNGLNGYE